MGSGSGTHLHMKGSKPEAATAGWGLFCLRCEFATWCAPRVRRRGHHRGADATTASYLWEWQMHLRGVGATVEARGWSGGERSVRARRKGQHGVVARWQLLAKGSERRHRGRVGRGQLHRCTPASTRSGIGSPLSGSVDGGGARRGPDAGAQPEVGGRLWGIVPRESRPEVTRASVCRGMDGISVHRGWFSPDERGELLGIPVTSVARTQFDLAAVVEAGAGTGDA